MLLKKIFDMGKKGGIEDFMPLIRIAAVTLIILLFLYLASKAIAGGLQ